MTASTRPADAVLRAGAAYLATQPFAGASLEALSRTSGIPLDEITRGFPTLHHLGTAILDHERKAILAVQARVKARSVEGPMVVLEAAFRSVGALLAKDVLVRAGVRLATEAREQFPERRLDPYAVWERFVHDLLGEAQASGALRAGVDVAGVSRLIVAAGMGTKDRLALHDRWEDAADELGHMTTTFAGLIVADRA